ncbi:MAG: MipA/OmpV family protein [Burkholderiales bacterium]
MPPRRLSPGFSSRGIAIAALLWVALSPTALARVIDPLLGTLVAPDHAGLGFTVRMERSPYRDVDARYDLVPLYLYENDHVYLHAYRAGLKLPSTGGWRWEMFLAARLEGFPVDGRPAFLQGMDAREPGVDAGLAIQHTFGDGTVTGELRHDAARASHGTELRLGYWHDIEIAGWTVLPHALASLRDNALNDYYFGVHPHEARPGRPEYHAGAGIHFTLGIHASHALTAHWRVIGGMGMTRLPGTVRSSPVVGNDALVFAHLGLAYDFEPDRRPWQERAPLLLRVLQGRSTGCSMLPILTLHCTSLDTPDRTRITAVEFGRPFAERFHGWPLDFVGYLGMVHHDERGLQPDGWQFTTYMKAYFDGFPWREHLRTRAGFGAGISWANRVPYVEARDQAARDRTTSKLLNYLDASIDANLGDLFGSRRLSETVLGLGVSHRSGIFGTSQLLGNVNGGSNYLYTFVETTF